MAGTENVRLFFALVRAGVAGETPDLTSFEGQWDRIDLPALAELAVHHDVVANVFAACGCSAEPPLQRLKDLLKHSFGIALAKSINQDREGTALLLALEEEGIDHIPLKGWVLRELYADPFSRSMADLDILIRDYRHEKIKTAVEKLGFASGPTSVWKHDSFEKAPYLKVEFHKRLLDESGAAHEWENSLWDRCIPEDGYRHCYRMTREDFYIFHMLHMHKDFKNGKFGVRRVADTWLLRKTYPDLDGAYLHRQFDAMKIATFVARMEHFALACFEGVPFEQDEKYLLRYLWGGGINGNEKLFRLGKMLSTREDSMQKAKRHALLRAAFPAADKMKIQYPALEKHPVLLPLFWLHRGIQFSGDAKKRLKKTTRSEISKEDFDEMKKTFQAGGITADEETRR